jgi:CHAD domain-containing protein
MLQLSPDLPAQAAVKLIYRELLETIKANEKRSISGKDRENLHDFRVAIRKTRAGLSQLKTALPDEISCRFKQYFAWLGQITTPLRDFDVYIENFPHYQAALPLTMQPDLVPLLDFLTAKQHTARQELALHLKSPQYLNNLKDWETYLTNASQNAAEKKVTVKKLADSRIWLVYQKVVKQGKAVKTHSPAAALHELRKTCKKLRYLIEFFQSLYPPEKIKLLIKALRELQEILGTFQDCSVQEQTLHSFSVQMHSDGSCSADTLAAIEELIQILDIKRAEARDNFDKCFAKFASARNQKLFKQLFAAKKSC